MLTVPKKFADRVVLKLKSLQNIVQSCRDRDINESDTVTLVMDVLCDLLGYDKYAEITKEHAVRSTFCDLAIKTKGKIDFLVECKAIGITLKDNHMQQALNYAANQGCEWVILTNAATWKLYRVIFGQPIDKELIFEMEFTALSSRRNQDIELLYSLAREGIDRSALTEYCASQQAKDKYTIAALILTEPIYKIIRKELKSLTDIAVPIEEIEDVLKTQVLKREVVEGDKAVEAQKLIKKQQRRRENAKAQERNDCTSAKIEEINPEEVSEQSESVEGA